MGPGLRLEAAAEAAAPLAFVMVRVADADAHEARARRAGIEVERTGPAGPAREGLSWRVGFEMLGARRDGALRIAALAPDAARLATSVSGVEGDLAVALAPLGPERTRIEVALTLAARGLGARLALAPMRLAQGELERRLARGVGDFAERAGAAWARERPEP